MVNTLTVEADLFEREQVDPGHVRVLQLFGLGLFLVHEADDLAARLLRVHSLGSVLFQLVVRDFIGATDLLVHALGRTLVALVSLVIVRAVAWVQGIAVHAVGGKLGDGLLAGQIRPYL